MGSNDKKDATFHPGQAPVYGYTPMDWLANYGRPVPPDPDPAVDREHWASPGVPPWGSLHQDIGHEPKRPGLPAWAWVSIVLGVVLLVCGSSVAISLLDESGPVPAVRTPASTVTTSGTCEKRIVGDYGLVATVTAVNTTDKPQTGTVWVRWPITGEAAQEFPKLVTLAPGASVEHTVNQEVPAERWFRTGACSFGWTPKG